MSSAISPLPNLIDTRYNSVKGYLDVFCNASPGSVCFCITSDKGLDQFTYRELYDRSMSMARAMIKDGMSGKCVAFIAENRFEHYVCMFGAFLAGAIYLPINPAQNIEVTVGMANFTDVEVIFVSEAYKDVAVKLKKACSTVKKIVGLDASVEGCESYAEMLKHGAEKGEEVTYFGDFDDNRTAMLCFTSGTSAGKPKCVEMTCKNIFSPARHSVVSFVDVAHTKNVTYSPLPNFHLASVCVALGYVFTGCSTLAASANPKNVLKDVRVLQPHFIQLVPAIAKLILSMLEGEVKVRGDDDWFETYKKECDSGIHPIEERRTLCKKYLEPVGGRLLAFSLTGAGSDVEMIRRLEYFGITCGCDYGLTECSPLVSFDLSLHNKRYGSVGRILPYLESKVIDGVLYLRGESIMKGYYRNEEATKEILSEDGWLYTGDLAYVDSDRFLYIKGRAASVVVLSNGENIDVDELTSRFSTLPSIGEIVIIADKKNGNDTLGALVYPSKGSDFASVEKDIFELNEKLPTQKRVMRFRLVNKPFEKTAMMKIKRYLYIEEEI